MNLRRSFLFATILVVPVLMGAKGDGCGSGGGTPAGDTKIGSVAPSMNGTWTVTYENNLDVEIGIGGEVYTESLGAQGGVVNITHNGEPLSFDLDCSRPLVVCPSEIYPGEVFIRHDDEAFPRKIWVDVPDQSCSGMMVAPDPSECGTDTNNPDCVDVCDGTVTSTTKSAFGLINGPGDEYAVLLNAGIASNGLNCVLVGGSIATGDLTTSGKPGDSTWKVDTIAGEIVTAFAGGCVWVADSNVSAGVEAAIVGGYVRFATRYDAAR